MTARRSREGEIWHGVRLKQAEQIEKSGGRLVVEKDFVVWLAPNLERITLTKFSWDKEIDHDTG